ncbi:hypothetical protein C2G38_2029910 [Gigaspora rosea]|uniref:Uncharacterized protein n=1 Tax=Gigaspora rosea TaxID=44941 RepID=A0A397VYB7_9GLOM|nr:hypothetical protein C2G38_2029910 [Gigaspora rosea]
MAKRQKYIINLIFSGYLDETLHFGPFCYSWWISRPSEKNNEPCFLFPICLQTKILLVLNGCDFIIEIGQLNSQFGPHPSYICKCDGIQSELYETPTEAITTVYQQIFKYKSNFSGPEIMGYDTPHIVQEYLNGLPFRVFNYSFNKLRIWIFGINKSHNQKLGFAGHRFKSAFIYTYNKQRSIFFSRNRI